MTPEEIDERADRAEAFAIADGWQGLADGKLRAVLHWLFGGGPRPVSACPDDHEEREEREANS